MQKKGNDILYENTSVVYYFLAFGIINVAFLIIFDVWLIFKENFVSAILIILIINYFLQCFLIRKFIFLESNLMIYYPFRFFKRKKVIDYSKIRYVRIADYTSEFVIKYKNGNIDGFNLYAFHEMNQLLDKLEAKGVKTIRTAGSS